MALVIVALFIPNLIVFINNNKKQIGLIHQGGKQLDSTQLLFEDHDDNIINA